MEDPVVLLRAVSEPNRIRALFLLSRMEIRVTDLAEKLGLKHNLLSHHLKVLVAAGVLKKKRKGNQFFYYIKPDWQERVSYLFRFLKID